MGNPSVQFRLVICFLLTATLLLGTADAGFKEAFKNFSTSTLQYFKIFGNKPANVSSDSLVPKSCGEQMECVPRHLCGDNNSVIKDGRAIIDFRSASFSSDDNQGCLWSEKCCSLIDKIPNNDIDKKEKYVDRGCGYTNSQGIKISLRNAENGESHFGEFPWMLRVYFRSCATGECTYAAAGGGSLLTPNVAITAAHIIKNFTVGDIMIKAGEWDTRGTVEIMAPEERQVEKKIVHEHFNEHTGIFDVALLILESPFKLAEHIGTICLPSSDDKFTHRRCIVTGWGKWHIDNPDYPSILKKIELPIVNSIDCQNQLRSTRLGRYFELHNSFICAGGEKDRDACLGDGGAPLACPMSGYSNRYQLGGIVSWGLECGEENVPGVFANVPMLRHWIIAQLELNSISIPDY